jgi:hypothetical protein
MALHVVPCGEQKAAVPQGRSWIDCPGAGPIERAMDFAITDVQNSTQFQPFGGGWLVMIGAVLAASLARRQEGMSVWLSI